MANTVLKVIVAASMVFSIGMYVGGKIATDGIQKQAVVEGAGEYIIVSNDDHKQFRWIKPNCGPH